MATDWNVWGTIKQAAGLWFRKDGYALKVTPTGTTLTADRTINLPNANADTTLATIDGIQTLTNKSIDGGTASANNKLKLPEDTYANLVSLAGKAEGQIFYANDVDKVYYYNGTALIEVGSGSGTGKKNYILNPSAATDVSKWTASNFTATKDTSTSIPRETTTGTAFKLVSTSTSATFLSDAMLLDDTDLSKKLGVEIALNVADSSNWTIDILASATAGGSYARLPLSTDVSAVTTLPATVGVFKTTVDTVAATPYIKFKITSAATSKTGYFSDILVTPDGNTVVGPVIEEWKTFTPTITNLVLNSTGKVDPAGRYRRVGDSIEVEISAKNGSGGAASGSTIAVGLPVGCAVNAGAISSTTAFHSIVGTAYFFNTTLASNYDRTVPVVFYKTGSEIRIIKSGTSNFLAGTDVGTSADIGIRFTVPIAEWANSGTVNLAQNDEEYSSNFSTSTTASDTTSFAYGPNGSQIQSITASLDRTVQFQSPIQQGDVLSVEIQAVANGPWLDVAAGIGGINVNFTFQNGNTYGLGVYSTSSNTVVVRFGQYAYNVSTYGAAGVAWSAVTGAWKWRVRKTSGGKAIGFSHVVPGVSAGLVPAAGLPGRTDGGAVGAGYVGEVITASWSGKTIITTGVPLTTTGNIPKGSYLLTLSGDGSTGAMTRAVVSFGGTATLVYTKAAANEYVRTVDTISCAIQVCLLIRVTVAGTIVVQANATTGSSVADHRGDISLVRIA